MKAINVQIGNDPVIRGNGTEPDDLKSLSLLNHTVVAVRLYPVIFSQYLGRVLENPDNQIGRELQRREGFSVSALLFVAPHQSSASWLRGAAQAGQEENGAWSVSFNQMFLPVWCIVNINNNAREGSWVVLYTHH